eukprot:15453747-Alexandrium_andersonii.AAC.1
MCRRPPSCPPVHWPSRPSTRPLGQHPSHPPRPACLLWERAVNPRGVGGGGRLGLHPSSLLEPPRAPQGVR